MATVSAIFTFALPDDTSSDKFRIYVSDSEVGAYTLDTTFNYSYGYRTQEYDSIDDTKWYKIQFYNSVEDEAGPKSNPVYGGDFGDRDTPFLALSSSFDGANYASATDLYNLTNLTTTDISVSKVQDILRSTRAYIDLRLNDVNLSMFTRFFGSSVARKKYNAALRVIKNIELNLSAAVVFMNMSNSRKLAIAKGTTPDTTAISVGSTSVQSVSSGIATAVFDGLSSRYASMAASLFNSIAPNTVSLSYSDNFSYGPGWMGPLEAVGNIYIISGNTGDTFNQYTADLGDLGDDINGVSYSLENNCTVEGIPTQSVNPLESQSVIVDSGLYVNGVLYHLDNWTDNGGVLQPGKGGSTVTTDGFSIDFSTSTEYIDIIWNNTDAAGGFDLLSTDGVIYNYWILGDS